MTLLWIIPGIALPTLGGWLLLALLQGNRRVLLSGEQWFAAMPVGLLTLTLLVFATHSITNIPLALPLFLSVQLLLIAILGGVWFMFFRSVGAPITVPSQTLTKKMKVVLSVLLLWVAIKAIIAAITFLALTPTFLDDTLDNWNLRGKVFYVDQALTLAMPAEDPIASPLGVSSYSPGLPLMKTWLATLAGSWNDPLINLLHAVWYISALGLVYFALRRSSGIGWGMLGAYVLGSIPLYLMHGSNPYADAFVSVHVFLAVSFTYFALREHDDIAQMSFFRLAAFCCGLLPFTKNEGLLVYLPPIMLILVIALGLQWKARVMTIREIVQIVAWYIGCILVLALPWIIFKWANGLTFGNAKPVSNLDVGWQEGVVDAIAVNTFFEGNWLLLFPILFALLIWRFRSAFSSHLPLTAFFLMVSGGQTILFLFTGLSIEALLQTGLARGVVQQLPIIVLLTILLLKDAEGHIHAARQTLAMKEKNTFGSFQP